jgi:hypothetical protein
MPNSLNLQEIDQEQALNLTKFFVKSGQNILLFGRRGTGKTHIACQAILDAGYKVNYINLSVVERPDLAGYPNIYSNDDIVTFKSPQFLPTLKTEQKPDSVLLFDEIDKAPPEITSPLLEILQFRKINGKPINAIACVLTGNLPNEGSYSNQISSVLLDRGAKYILNFNFDKWLEWARNNNVHDLICGFLRNYPELSCGSIEESHYASPSPRGWTYASSALLNAKNLKVSDIDSITSIISGFVGYEAGLKFKIWYENYRKFESTILSLIETGTMSLDFHKLTQTEKMVFIISLCYITKQKVLQEQKKRNKLLENLCNFLINYKVDRELQIIGLYNSFDFNIITVNKLYTCKPFFELFTQLNENLTIKK